MRRGNRWIALAAALAVAGTSAAALGAASLNQIGALVPTADGTTDSRVYAISPDGAWAVGTSNAPNVSGTATITQPVVWSLSSGLVQLPNGTDFASTANGVVVLGNGDVGIGGWAYDAVTSSMRMHAYTVAPANIAGGTWVKTPASNSGNTYIGTYNAARTYDDGSGTHWAVAGQRGTTGRGVGSFPSTASTYCDYLTSGQSTRMNSLSRVPVGTYRVVGAGYDRGNAGLLRAVLGSAPNSSPQTVIPGGSAYESEALGISPDAFVSLSGAGGLVVGYDRDTTDNHYAHAFVWSIATASPAPMSLLGELPGDVASAAIDVRVIGGNSIIGGYSADGTVEKAVVWDNTGVWGGGGLARSVQAALNAAGVSTGDWTHLSRVTSMSDDGMTVAGWGIWAADGSTRGFVATIPEPATVCLLALALGALAPRRR